MDLCAISPNRIFERYARPKLQTTELKAEKHVPVTKAWTSQFLKASGHLIFFRDITFDGIFNSIDCSQSILQLLDLQCFQNYYSE